MHAVVRNPRSCISFEGIAPMDPNPWHLADIESTVERVMRAPGLVSPRKAVSATAFACLADPPGRWNAFALGFLVQAALLLVLANTTFFLFAPTLNQVDTRNTVHLVAPDLLQAPTEMNRKALDAPVPQRAKPSRLEVRIPHVTPSLILPPRPPIDVAKATLPATRTPAVDTRAFRGQESAAVPLVTREIVSTRFGTDSAAATQGKSARQVQTGGFGDVDGAQISAGGAGKGPRLAKVGAFNMPNGAGSGNGNGGARGVRSNSTSTSFGNAIGGEGESRATTGQGAVRSVNFSPGSALASAAPKRQATVLAASSETPVLLLGKPSLAYTSEARQRKIEGDVELDVLFTATGQVRVLRVIQGLGYGLDEAAVSAAEQIRFTPARREGQPVDSHGLLRIVFRLS